MASFFNPVVTWTLIVTISCSPVLLPAFAAPPGGGREELPATEGTPPHGISSATPSSAGDDALKQGSASIYSALQHSYEDSLKEQGLDLPPVRQWVEDPAENEWSSCRRWVLKTMAGGDAIDAEIAVAELFIFSSRIEGSLHDRPPVPSRLWAVGISADVLVLLDAYTGLETGFKWVAHRYAHADEEKLAVDPVSASSRGSPWCVLGSMGTVLGLMGKKLFAFLQANAPTFSPTYQKTVHNLEAASDLVAQFDEIESVRKKAEAAIKEKLKKAREGEKKLLKERVSAVRLLSDMLKLLVLYDLGQEEGRKNIQTPPELRQSPSTRWGKVKRWFAGKVHPWGNRIAKTVRSTFTIPMLDPSIMAFGVANPASPMQEWVTEADRHFGKQKSRDRQRVAQDLKRLTTWIKGMTSGQAQELHSALMAVKRLTTKTKADVGDPEMGAEVALDPQAFTGLREELNALTARPDEIARDPGEAWTNDMIGVRTVLGQDRAEAIERETVVRGNNPLLDQETGDIFYDAPAEFP